MLPLFLLLEEVGALGALLDDLLDLIVGDSFSKEGLLLPIAKVKLGLVGPW